MKKTLLGITLLGIFATGFMSCSEPAKWNEEQRKAMREALHDYRQMVYLSDLDDEEFLFFSDGVAVQIEEQYPIYTTFIQMPGMNDTVKLMVVNTIVDELNADARNIRHIYPYSYLVAEGTLPAGLDREQQHTFYKCLATKIDSLYTSPTQFFHAILADTTDLSPIRQAQVRCANRLFDWSVTEVEIIEATN